MLFPPWRRHTDGIPAKTNLEFDTVKALVNWPSSNPEAFLLLYPDIEYKVSSFVIQLHTTPVPLAHDKLLLSSLTVRVFGECRNLVNQKELVVRNDFEPDRKHTMISSVLTECNVLWFLVAREATNAMTPLGLSWGWPVISFGGKYVILRERTEECSQSHLDVKSTKQLHKKWITNS